MLAVRAITFYLIALQVADGISTHLALRTGLAEEKNQLLLSISQLLDVPVIGVVAAAKVVCAAFFAAAVSRTQPTATNVAILGGLAIYVTHVVAMNFYWAHILG